MELTDTNGQVYFKIPDEEACQTCHDGSRNQVLGFRPEQMDISNTQLRGFSLAGLFDSPANEAITTAQKLPDPYDENVSLDKRVRSYFEVNCASCHNPKGEAPHIDLSYSATREETDLIQKGIIDLSDLNDSEIRESLLPTSRDISSRYFERMSPATVSSDPLMKRLLLPWLETWSYSDDQRVDQVEEKHKQGRRDRD